MCESKSTTSALTGSHKVYTSYYAKAKNLNPDNWAFICISNSIPTWWDKPIKRITCLIPKWYLVDGLKLHTMTWERYTDEYEFFLNDPSYVNRAEVIGYINELLKTKNVVLLCYEAPDKPCHRHLVAKWLAGDFDVTELTETA